jgi:mevalonate kinase
VNGTGHFSVTIPELDAKPAPPATALHGAGASGPGAEPSASSPDAACAAPSWTHSWPLAEISALLAPAYASYASSAAAAEGPCPAALKPDARTLDALQAATAAVGPMRAKAMMPALFLAAGVFAPHFFGGAGAPSLPGLSIVITMPTLPVAAGLGSSAAFSTATAAALLDLRARHVGSTHGLLQAGAEETDGGVSRPDGYARPDAAVLPRLNDWAYSAEMLFHGSPSGLDNTVSTYGGALAYSKGGVVDPIRCSSAQAHAGSAGGHHHQQPPPQQSGPSVGSIVHVAGMPPLRLLVTNTKVPKETSKLVAGVRVLHDAMPTVVRPIIAAIDGISHECLRGIEEEAAWRAVAVAQWRKHATVGAAGGGSSSGNAGSGSPPLPLDQVPGFRGLGLSDPDDASADGSGGAPPIAVPAPAATPAAVPGAAVPGPLVLPELSDALYARLRQLVRVNHSLLNALGVGHAALDGVVAAAAAAGFVAKLTGAGGGGCALTLLPPRRHVVAAAGNAAAAEAEDAAAAAALKGLEAGFAALGYDCFETRLGGDGVLVRRA